MFGDIMCIDKKKNLEREREIYIYISYIIYYIIIYVYVYHGSKNGSEMHGLYIVWALGWR